MIRPHQNAVEDELTYPNPYPARFLPPELKQVPKCEHCTALILWENPAETCQFCKQPTRRANTASHAAEHHR